MADKDGLDKIQEWQQHQHNPYYWVNKYPSFLFPRRTLRIWILSLIEPVLFVSAFLFVLWRLLVERNSAYIFLVVALGVFSIIVILRARAVKPDWNPEKSQIELEQQNRIEKKEKKKKLPKKRKDYG